MSTDVVTDAAEFIKVENFSAVRVLSINNPPVNALSVAVRIALLNGIVAGESDPSCKAILLTGEGNYFLGGADIKEFGEPHMPPILPDLCDRIESCTKPVIAALHGACLGGGLEVALAAHYRIASEDSKIGFPEVNLGILPGAGGTQRTPRLIGANAALDLMLSGRHATAQEALAWGLIDEVAAPKELSLNALAYAERLIAVKAEPRRTSTLTRGLDDATGNIAAIAVARVQTQKKARGLFSPFKIVDLVEAATTLSFQDGGILEREAFQASMASPQHDGLIHAFLSERATTKTPETQLAKPRVLNAIGVVGGGTMGAGIAVSMLDAGFHVTMVERDAAALARGKANIEKVYDGLISKGRMDIAFKYQLLSRLGGSLQYQDLKHCDLVIEAVFEEMSVKLAVLAELDKICRHGTIIATNTSYLDVAAMAASISRPQDVIGLHFFSPANIMKLLEIVVPDGIAPDVVATGFELARRLKKIPVRSGVGDGFIGNRILGAYRMMADYCVEDGASPYEVDAAMRDFGFAMGIFQVADLAGGDIGWATRKRRAPMRDPRQRYVQIADRLCERGWFGQKTARGYYQYIGRTGLEDSEVLEIIEKERRRAGITPRTFSSTDIMVRIMSAMINEGCKVLEEKVALRPLDIDVVFVHGYGFPRYRGGPMHYADVIGLPTVLENINRFALEENKFWQPSDILIRLVADGKKMSSLNVTSVT